jgi:hypothetical protein
MKVWSKRMKRRVLALAATVVTVTAGTVVATASPAFASEDVISPDGGAKAILTYTGTSFTIYACDSKPDGHHAEATLKVDALNHPVKSYRVKNYNGYNTCTSLSGTFAGCQVTFTITAENWEGSTLLSRGWWDIEDVRFCNPV